MIQCKNIPILSGLSATSTVGNWGPEPMHNAVQFKADGDMNFFIYNCKSGILVFRPDGQVFIPASEIIALAQSKEPKFIPVPKPPETQAK